MWRRWAGLLIPLAACGRLGFGESGEPAAIDGAPSVDGALAPADAAPPFCSTVVPAPTFCDDFDSGVFGERWTMRSELNGGFVEATATQVRSAPTAARHRFEDQANGITAASLDLQLSNATSRFTVGFDLFVVVRPTTGSIEIAGITVVVAGMGSFFQQITLSADGVDTYLEEFRPEAGGFMYGETVLAAGIPTGQWVHVDLDLATDLQTYLIKLDGTAVAEGTCRYELVPGPVLFDSGISWASGALTASEVIVDNVVINAS